VLQHRFWNTVLELHYTKTGFINTVFESGLNFHLFPSYSHFTLAHIISLNSFGSIFTTDQGREHFGVFFSMEFLKIISFLRIIGLRVVQDFEGGLIMSALEGEFLVRANLVEDVPVLLLQPSDLLHELILVEIELELQIDLVVEQSGVVVA